jgi:hypothetical protein
MQLLNGGDCLPRFYRAGLNFISVLACSHLVRQASQNFCTSGSNGKTRISIVPLLVFTVAAVTQIPTEIDPAKRMIDAGPVRLLVRRNAIESVSRREFVANGERFRPAQRIAFVPLLRSNNRTPFPTVEQALANKPLTRVGSHGIMTARLHGVRADPCPSFNLSPPTSPIPLSVIIS